MSKDSRSDGSGSDSDGEDEGVAYADVMPYQESTHPRLQTLLFSTAID